MEINVLYSLIVPLIICVVAVFALHKRVDVFAALTTGAKDGLNVIIRILPPLVALLTAVYMLRASGALSALENLLRPALIHLGIPPETAALIFIRPFSGSGSLAVGAEIINSHGADSFIGRVTAVMLGSTETTFYIIAVYFGAVGIKKTRYAIPSALSADFVGFIAASITVRLFF
ncbi:MAG: spore maturation protein [Oscillospiraceae bacterium]|nr:spore maturation protein [Oscillospiraceae bacterium]